MSKHKETPRIDPLTCALPSGGIDTHAHLNDPAFSGDLGEVLKRARQCGVSRIANVFLNPAEFPRDAELFRDHPEVFFLLGVHPDDAGPFSQETLALIRTHIRENPRIRAIGEIGLDYSRPDPECTPHDIQKAVFRAQLGLARELDIPVAIHCRDAEEDTLSILESENFSGRPLVWHCFGGGPDLVQRIVKNGWYVALGGTVTFKNNPQAREAVPFIPEDRLLMETDCPYLSPVPWRGTRNEPAYTVFTIRTLAECRGTSPEILWQQCGRNAETLFRLAE